VIVKMRPVIYPFLIGSYPILARYVKNAWDVPLSELGLPIGLVAGAALVLWGLLMLALRDPHRAGLLTLLAVTLVATIEHSTGAVNRTLHHLSVYWVARSFNVWPPLVKSIQVALFAGLAYLALWRVKGPRRWTPFLNVFAVILVVMPLISIARVRMQEPAAHERPYPPLAALGEPEQKPDIYYIILDGFARADVMKELFDFDLEPFLAGLERRGFYVARRAMSNYSLTPQSLSSSLNGVYHDDQPGSIAINPVPPLSWYRENAVIRTLRPLGYKFVSFSSGFDFTEFPHADLYLSPYRYLSNFHRMLLEGSPFAQWLPNPMERDSYTMTRERTLHLARRLPEVAKMDGPTFTVAHILSPHPPFVFGPEGEDVSPRHVPYYLNDGNLFRGYYGDGDSYVAGYRGQIPHLVKLVEEAIDGILANSAEPPIIIVQSDHGSGLHLEFGNAETTDHWERMSILNAYYLPGGKHEGLSERISPVNSFRVVLNNYFGAELELLPDESYFVARGWGGQFTRVTERAMR
jgi:hypothetical protein